MSQIQTPEILTITLNPALDLSSAVDRMVAGPKLRMDPPRAEPGGGGINVARAAVKLGAKAHAVAALGGATGQRLAALIAQTGVRLIAFDLPGDTRENLAVTDRSSGAQYRLQRPGPDWTPALEQAITARIVAEAEAMGAAPVLVLSGSQPPGLSDGFAQALCRRLPAAARLVIDTSGAALERLVQAPQPEARPFVLRMDQEESEGLAGHPLPDIAASLDFAAALVARGAAEAVVLARGAEGSVLATADLRLHARPPVVEVVSKIGAGDSFTAAFALALTGKQDGAGKQEGAGKQHGIGQQQGPDWATALLHGTAAAAAAVMTPGTELCRAEDAAALLPRCRLDAAP